MAEHGSAANTAGMGAERIARNDAIFREANEGIGDAADELGIPGLIPFVCECADPACRDLVRLSLEDYQSIRSDPRLFVNAVGHEQAGQGWAEVVAQSDGHVVVEKVGRAGVVAEQLEDVEDAASAPVDGKTA